MPFGKTDSENGWGPGFIRFIKARRTLIVCLIAAAFLAWLYMELKPTTWNYYTDDISVRRLARDVKPRFVLWEKAAPLEGEANLPSENIQPAISPDGARMVFSRGLENGNADLCLSRWDGNSWSSPEPQRALNSKFNEISPAFSRDGSYLYFSTDRPGGFGGYDVWVARWDGAEFAWPQPLSVIVNSRFDDIDPCSSADDGKLYFSSNRPRQVLKKVDDLMSYKDLRNKFKGADYDIYAADRIPAGVTNREVERAMSLLYSLRESALTDTNVMEKLGGNARTEKSVDLALAWLARNQETNGNWSIEKFGGERGHDVAATSASLLVYFGRGVRHDKPGKYQETVSKGLKWLLSQQNKLSGDLRGPHPAGNSMYDQGFATLALVEAYGVSKDPDLFDAAQSAVYFIADSQNDEDGGWRYQPKNPGDLSVSGWIIMALKSAELSGINVPEKTMTGVRKFLKSVRSGKGNGLFSYLPSQQGGHSGQPAMQVTGFFCSQLMGLPANSPAAFEAADWVQKTGIKVGDAYYSYYGTLSSYQNQGPLWREWKKNMQESFVSAQDSDGSWNITEGHGRQMGRVISTALITLSLEAHYRYVPLYGLGFEPDPAVTNFARIEGDQLAPVPEFDRSRPIAELNSAGDDLHAAVTGHGDFLYFASNRGDSFGGFDIYRSRISGNTISLPENLGQAVNTSADEKDPAVRMAGFDLIFASNRDKDAGRKYKLYTAASRIVFQRYDYSKSPTLGWIVDNLKTPLIFAFLGLVVFVYSFAGSLRKQRKLKSSH